MKSTFQKIMAITLLFAFIALTKVLAQNQPVVKTNKGYIRGEFENGTAVFKGVPYAAPPVGAARYLPPAEHVAWKDTLQTQKFGPIATQPDRRQVLGTEDCLSLNIYTPKTDNKKRAVLVWVHGGSMTAGAGKGEDGHAFADNDDIVTVTINYRLGALGFLYLGDLDNRYAQSGNNGLLDCVMALKWIKQNIALFGGDANRVTIMGESAGAKLISAVLVSPKSKGLFQQYIAESGSVQCIRDTLTAKNERLKILKQLGLGKNDARKLLLLPADSIIKAQAIVCAGIGGNSFFGPVYDGVTITGDAYKYVADKDIPHIKALIGTNKYEAALFINGDEKLKHPDTVILRALFGDDYPMVYKTFKEELNTNTPYDAAVKVITQYMYQMHSYRFAKALSQNEIPVWVYRFDYDNGKKYGANHGAELQYVWNDPKLKAAEAERQQLAAAMHRTWVSFIKNGNPNSAALPAWPRYKNETRQIMTFDKVNKVITVKEVFDDKSFPSQVFMLKGKNSD
ncbi:carboxylesterase/lipase family protein [Mucilaginibacter xinganensis]|uniref:Carboxylic ester hydrolase n=1 Tax=Mucilaginibacter xinganensis TaxID=1234841 RepID=A0A223P093_9SPHI|nr:carboxylesterase family protein [Mucilaginibacter xinganensis]ASU35527.1 para-nitrobenzyl esterase [Mucilaginibacter xinganensis]